MNIGISHNWPDYNKGDSAILIGMLNYIKKHFPVKKIALFSIYQINPANSIFDIDNLNLAKRLNVEISRPLASFTILSGRNKLIKAISILPKIIKYELFLQNPPLFSFLLSANDKIIINQIVLLDLVISKGGHIFKAKRFNDNIGLYNASLMVRVCKKLNVKIYLFSQSFGPFESKLSKHIIKNTLSKTDLVLCRETTSIKELKSITNSNFDIIKFFPDFAFNINPLKNEEFEELNTLYNFSGSVGITIRQHSFKKSSEKEYVEAILEIISTLAKWKQKIIIIPQCTGPTDVEDDRIIAAKLYQLIPPKIKSGVLLFNHIVSSPILTALYGELHIMIGTRFHSVILSLLMGVPSFAISYYGPKAEIMEEFEMKDYMMDIEDVFEKKEEMLVKVKQLIIRRDYYSELIKLNLKKQTDYFNNSIDNLT